MSPIRTAARRALIRSRAGIIGTVAALAAGAIVIVATNGASDADAKPINPYVPCPQWQEMHPDWPCWGNFPEIEEPTAPTPPTTPLQPAVPTVVPSTPPAPPAAALTPPAPLPAPDPCLAIIPVPGYQPPALPGQPPHAPCSGSEPSQRVPTPRELLEPYIHPACGLSPLGPDVVHEIVIEIVGPLEAELGPDDPFVSDVIKRVNDRNSECFGNKSQIKQKVWDEVRNEWYRKFRERNIKRDRTKKECGMNDTSKDCEGLVAVCTPDPKGDNKLPVNLTPIQERNLQAQANKYIDAANDIIYGANATGGSPLVRQRLSRAQERAAGNARTRQRNNNRALYYPPTVDTDMYPSGAIVAGHLPDTTWTGDPDPPPHRWAPMDESLNGSIGWQARQYPVNYKARAFVPGEWLDGACVPSIEPRILRGPPPSLAHY
ncbi:hypothetical protein DFR70_111181 [Nocardia tenerifensis]|uniref:Uncharacterized protein n=1 Tax=Nocardia tenerifensis TaxID=228006 RepID=A0A318JYJ7_9NOCA|nr:hypothetical protein [Nocardia tenerifensis]PXX59797.1 hypothetical protein DFR70_111181 [Nocardia tenerifensis]